MGKGINQLLVCSECEKGCNGVLSNFYDCVCGNMWMRKSYWKEQVGGGFEQVIDWLLVPDTDPVFKRYILRCRKENAVG